MHGLPTAFPSQSFWKRPPEMGEAMTGAVHTNSASSMDLVCMVNVRLSSFSLIVCP
jgi:hypothetical protein